MKPTLSFRELSLYLLLIITGLYAGMLFFHEMCPVEADLTANEYGRYWQIVDGKYMHARMAKFGPALLMTFFLTLLLNIRYWNTAFFLVLSVAFVLLISDVAFSVAEQAPINSFIRSLDPANLSSFDTVKLEQMRLDALENFHVRFVFGLVTFSLVATTPFLNGYTRTGNEEKPTQTFHQKDRLTGLILSKQ